MLNHNVSRRSLFAGLFAGLLAAVCPRRAAAAPPPPVAQDLPVTFSASGLPAGLQLNSNTGVLDTLAVVSDGTINSCQRFTWRVLPGTSSGAG
jgi:hypothetical protein